MPITALFAGLLALLFVGLAVRVIGARRGARVSIGDGGDKTLTRRVRVHGNFAEYVPMALVLMGLAESMGAWKPTLWLTGAALLIGRLLHAYGVSQINETLAFRITGTALTFTAILLAGVLCLILGWPLAMRSGFGI